MNHSFLTLRNKTFKPDVVDHELRKIVFEKWGAAFIIKRNNTYWEVKHPTAPGLGTSLWIETSRKLEFREGYTLFASWVSSYIRESLGVYFKATCGDEGINERWKPDPTKFPDYKSYFDLVHESLFDMTKEQKIEFDKMLKRIYEFDINGLPKELKKMKDKIKSLIDQYDKDNAFKSWHNFDDPSLKAILNMGEEAVPYLLQFVGMSWVPVIALHFITKEEVVEEKDFGKYDVINKSWINWGKEKGYL